MEEALPARRYSQNPQAAHRHDPLRGIALGSCNNVADLDIIAS
jgi:hypothetical protein